MIPEINTNGSKVDPTTRSKGLDEKSKLKLQKAVKDFESLFVNYLLQNMRKTVQKSEEEESGFGGEMMQGMFDLEISKHVASGSSLGIGEMLYKQMTGEALPKSSNVSALRMVRSTESASASLEKTIAPPEAVTGTPSRVLSSAVPLSSPQDQGTSVPRQVPGSQKPVPSAFTPVFGPPAAVASVPDHVKVARVAPDSTSTAVPKSLGQYDNIIRQASDTFDISANLIKAVIAAESTGNARAISSKNAKGVMQLIDSTASAMGVTNVWNPQENIFGGSKYLKQMLDRFNGDIKLAVASYNAGPGAVEKHGGVPPFSETRRYVEKVMNYLRLLEQKGVMSDEER